MNDACKEISINLRYSYVVIAKSAILNSKFINIKESLIQEFKGIE